MIEQIDKLKKHIYESGKLNSNRTHSFYIKKHFFTIYEQLYKENQSEQEFKESLYKLLFNIKQTPKCANPNCNNLVKFNKFSAGYLKYCSYKCVHTDIGNNKKFIKRVTASAISNRNKNLFNKLNGKYQEYDISINDNEITIHSYCSHGDLTLHIHDFIKVYKTDAQTICPTCHDFYISKWMPTTDEYNEQHNLITKLLNVSKFNLTEKRVKRLYPKMFRCINLTAQQDSSWSEKVYAFNNKIKERPICVNCKINNVHFLPSIHQYSKHCKTCCDNKDFTITLNYKHSRKEKELLNYIKSIYKGEILTNKRLNNNEIDILIPELNLGIEFNGLYWHGDLVNTDSQYHYKKWKYCKDNDIFLFTIWEDDWDNKKDLIKSMIDNRFDISKRIYARKCEIREVSSKENMRFCNENHIQGGVAAKVKLGLFYENELVSIMTFGKNRTIMNNKPKDDEFELLRFCSKRGYSVIGGASKLFKYFINKYNPKEIVSYANCDISNGNLYKQLRFKEIRHTGVNYWWVVKGTRRHRSNFMKHKLVAQGEDPNKTEDKIMRSKGYYKIWGTGNLLYVYNHNE